MQTDALRALPSVDQVLNSLKDTQGLPSSLVANEVRAVLAERREALRTGSTPSDTPIEQLVEQRLAELMKPSLRPVINATGVVLHTNLGRAPLADFQPIPRYSNLEYDLHTGKRGKRDVHIQKLLQALLGKPAIVVNNNAAAVYLVLNELAAGYEVIVSRGELIEIGDGFRIPEIMARSGAVLREVGATNRTRLNDYRQAINERTRLILRVHPSNFRISGFTARPELNELAQLGRECGIPVYEDLGSGCLVDLRANDLDEPLVSESLAAGVDLVSFSCDKLLGGPQSGIVAGDGDLVARIRRNPMYRAFRVDKLIVEALETTLRHLVAQNWKAIPTLQMIFATPGEIRGRAERVARQLEHVNAAVRESESAIGGGSTPDRTLPTWVVELAVPHAAAFEHRLRRAPHPVIARIERDKIILDMRTVADGEEASLIAAIHGAR
ncbi:MAG TPA: L-seryl-tRNA(Sec) selenium transferase [Bryobacteraceae bacterium]|jgi:L-seryl-tRNA(Ser) seleniumtransferase|nr:L-seryl-tRNA(Sec) selenium transferase [Bryobacteraceae bacterium]